MPFSLSLLFFLIAVHALRELYQLIQVVRVGTASIISSQLVALLVLCCCCFLFSSYCYLCRSLLSPLPFTFKFCCCFILAVASLSPCFSGAFSQGVVFVCCQGFLMISTPVHSKYLYWCLIYFVESY